MKPIIYVFCISSTFVGTIPANKSTLNRFLKSLLSGSSFSSFGSIAEGDQSGDEAQLSSLSL